MNNFWSSLEWGSNKSILHFHQQKIFMKSRVLILAFQFRKTQWSHGKAENSVNPWKLEYWSYKMFFSFKTFEDLRSWFYILEMWRLIASKIITFYPEVVAQITLDLLRSCWGWWATFIFHKSTPSCLFCPLIAFMRSEVKKNYAHVSTYRI